MAKEEKQVNEAQFLKSLNKKKAAAKVAAKAERPSGILDDAAIMQRLGLAAKGDNITVSGRVSKVQLGYAKQDTDRPYFRFAYSLSDNSPLSGKGKGLIVSNYHELTEASKDGEVWRTEEDAFEQMFFEFQGLGENTAEWKEPITDAVKCAKTHTADKTEVQLNFAVFERRNGELGMNTRVVGPVEDDNSDLEDDEDEDEEDEDEEEVAPKTTKSTKKAKKPEPEEEEDEDEEVSYEDWVDGWVDWTDDEGTETFKVTAYDEDANTFSGVDEDDNEYEAPADECEWAEDQKDD